MKYPMINRQPRREVNVPELNGGLNLRDSLSGVRDNQMTDCVNMWYKDGMLRTRPPFTANNEMKLGLNAVGDTNYIVNIVTHTDVQNGEAVLVSAIRCDGEKGKDSYYWQMGIQFWWQYPNKVLPITALIVLDVPDFKWESEDSILSIAKKCSRFVTAKDGVAYCYSSNGEDFGIYKLEYLSNSSKWVEATTDEIYAPTVYAHCKRTGWDDFEGTQFEGYNIIGNSYKMIYSAYNELDSDESHPMRYKLGQDLPESGVIKVSITTCIKGEDETNERETKVITTTHEIQYDKGDYDKFTDGQIVIEKFGAGNTSEDGLRLFVKYNYIGFVIASEDDGNEDKVFVVATLETDEKRQRYACNEDNIVITAPLKVNKDDKKKVFCMTSNIWFGGAANGINDGSRLFLCGNTNKEEKALVVWSGLNDPLYFPENNYAYVGDKSQAVTTFGQQGENLIIFKEKSTFYSYYASNSDIDADDLINQSVVDYEANAVCFPMIQINSSIGCDCPNTVELCRNRLVWTNSDGNVYTLFSNNQYSERTIYKVSDMIYSELAKENDLKNAVSCDFEGHYLLAVKNKIYVMDYNSYGYQYASSFSKNEDGNVQIPWYIWTHNGSENGKFYKINNRMMLAMSFKANDGVVITFSMLSPSEKTKDDIVTIYDDELKETKVVNRKIASRLQTKLFDFSSVGYLKNIDRVSIAFGNNNGDEINVGFVSNVGSNSESVSLISGNTDECDAAFISIRNFYPSARAVRTFGVKIECEGQLIVNSLSVQYRLLGGVK